MLGAVFAGIYADGCAKRKPSTVLIVAAGVAMLVLGIESSCDETAAAVVRRDERGQGQILSNVVLSQVEHSAYGGVVPEIAARAHVERLDGVVADAMSQAGVTFSQLDAVAATAGPGLVGGLIAGVITGKAIALAHGIPFLAINHLEAHALTAGLTDQTRPPYLMLLVSGGHTQLLWVRDVGRYERLATTIDDAAGEAFDKTAKLLGLPQPGGPAVEQAAAGGDSSRFDFPRPMLGREEPHFSFAGLKTAVRRQSASLAPFSKQDVADICASFQAAVADCMVDRCAHAMRRVAGWSSAPPLLVVAGGVAANAHLRHALDRAAQQHGFGLIVPPASLCGDNGAMVAWTGAERLAHGMTDGLDADVRPRWPLDPEAQPVRGAGVKA